MKGEEQSRYFCADKKEEMLKIMAAVVKAKVSYYHIRVYGVVIVS